MSAERTETAGQREMTEASWKAVDLTVALQARGVIVGFDMAREILVELDEAAKGRRLLKLQRASVS